MINTVELSLTGLCNLKCSFCPHAADYPNDNSHHMSIETLKLVADHLRQMKVEIEVHLSGRGEPTLHKHFPEAVDILTSVENVKVRLTTNGARIRRHLESVRKVHSVLYNVYSDDDAVFWEEVEYCENNGIPIYNMDLKSLDGKFRYLYDPKYGDMKRHDFILTNRGGNIESEAIRIIPGSGYCFRPFEKIFINYNGDYVLCCDDWSDKALSNVREESIIDYYNSNPTLMRIKEDLTNDVRNGVCKICTFPG